MKAHNLPIKCLINANVITLLVTLIGCGGGGGGGGSGGSADKNATPIQNSTVAAVSLSSTSSTASSLAVSVDDYVPNPILLTTKAADSTDLYVNENFTFTDTQRRKIKVTAQSADGFVITNALVRFYAISEDLDLTTQDTSLAQTLVFSAYTDSYGEIYRDIELPVQVKALYVQIDTIGIDNQMIKPLEHEDVYINFR